MLNDIASFHSYLEQKEGQPVSGTVAAHRWLEDLYDPVVTAIPAGLRDRLAPPEVFHEVLEHRWYLPEQAGRDVGTTEAARSYFSTVLPHAPRPLTMATEDAAELEPRLSGKVPLRRHSADLMLCGHRYRVCRRVRGCRGANIYDMPGEADAAAACSLISAGIV